VRNRSAASFNAQARAALNAATPTEEQLSFDDL
jgi:hypothetical protein